MVPIGCLRETTLHVYKDEFFGMHAYINMINKYGIEMKYIETIFQGLRKA